MRPPIVYVIVYVVVALLLVAGCSGRQPVSWTDGASPGTADGASPSGPDAGLPWPPAAPDAGAPNKTVPCDPARDYQPTATLFLQGGKVIARLFNPGCKVLYRQRDCCNNGPPTFETSSAGGGWSPTCPPPKLCGCAAEPTCEPFLQPGQTVEERLGILEGVDCCGTTFRVTYFFSRTASCIDDALYPVPTAISNGLKLHANNPCDGPHP